MHVNRIVEYAFFFGFLGFVTYLVFRLFEPFLGALALAAIVVTICYPMYVRVRHIMPGKNRSLAAFVSLLLVLVVVVVPLVLLGFLIFKEAAAIYTLLNTESTFSLERTLGDIEHFIQVYIPGFSINITAYVQQAAAFIASNIAAIFTGTASTIFMFFIALIAMFYFFRDGREFTHYLVEVSPLPEKEDKLILKRLARSVRSVALGTVLVALIQGTLTAIGLALFGFERAILWGAVAAFGALIPGIGTSIVFVPSFIYLMVTGSYLTAVGVAVWAALAVGLIDNFLGPYFMSKGATLHPFLILLAVIGGIVFFGPIGFVIGPVILSLFKVLLEIYATHISRNSDSV